MVEPRNSTALNITIRVPNEYDMNGLIAQIGISYRPLIEDSNTNLNFSQQIHDVEHALFFDGRVNYTVILTDLSYFTRFELFLNFSTVVGFGGASDTVMNRTSEHGKRLNDHIYFCNVHMGQGIQE